MLWLVVFLLAGCLDDQPFKDQSLTADENIIEMARHFHEQESIDIIYRESNDARKFKSFRGALEKVVRWESARKINLSVGVAVVVPLEFKQDMYVKQDENGPEIDIEYTTYLLIYKGVDQMMHSEMVTSIPDKSYIEAAGEAPKFTGLIIVEDWQGNFLKGYKNTANESDVLLPPTKTVSSGRVMCQDTYWYSCVTVGESTMCSYDYTETSCYSDGTGSGGTGTGTGTGSGDYGGSSGGSTGSSGTGTSGSKTINLQADNFQACPTNFTFTVATNSDLWQEAAISNI